jgi:two-component system, OmpR family, phosphate regulon sensor histidine kinase PhoR
MFLPTGYTGRRGVGAVTIRVGTGLRARLLLLVGLAVIPALGLAVYSGRQYRLMVATRAREETLQVARIVAIAQDRQFRGIQNLLVALAQVPEVRGTDHAACSAFLTNLLQRYPNFTVFGVTDLKGDILSSAVPSKKIVNVADRLYFRRAMATGDFAVGEYQVSRLTGKTAINCGYPIRDASGQIVGLVFAGIDLTSLERLGQEADLPEGASLNIIDAGGVILLRYPRGRQWVGKSSATLPALQAVAQMSGGGTREAAGLDGVIRIYSMVPLQGPAEGIRIIAGVSRDRAFAEVEQIFFHNVILLVSVALMALITAIYGVDIIQAWLSPLTSTAQRLAAGDLTARTGLAKASWELAQLASAFDQMADSLQQRDADLRRASEFSSLIVDTAGMLVVVIDVKGRIIRFNRCCEETTGYSRAEVVNQPFWDIFIRSEEIGAVMAVWRRLTAGHFPMIHENYWRTRDGGLRLISWSNTCVLNDQGEVEHVIATGLDVTDARHNEEELRLDEARMAALLKLSEMTEASLQEITDFALEEAVRQTRSQIGYLAFMNEDESVLTMHSWSKAAMAECAISDKPIVYPVVSTGLWGEAVRQRKPVITNNYEAPNPLKKGCPVGHVLVTRHMNIPVFDGERIVAVAGVGNKAEPYGESDILQLRLLMGGMWRLLHRKRAAEALQRAHDELEVRVAQRTAELARSNAELQQFAYVASHDLQEPLRKITSFGDRLVTKSGDTLNEEGRQSLERMQSAARRMGALITGLLAYSRVSTQTRPFESISLKEVALEVLSDLEVALTQSGGNVTVGDLPTIEADPLQMRQLLQNLIANALKFHREGVPPQVTVSAEVLPAEAAGRGTPPQPTRCRLIIADNGIGFETRFTDRIFEVFQRLHDRESYEGTGIGLAICRKIVERHGGTIDATGTPGVGAAFTITMPLKQGAPQP